MSSLALLDRLDSRAETADAITQVRLDALEVGARRLALAAHWADQHPVEDLPVHVRGRQVGAAGTPEAGEVIDWVATKVARAVAAAGLDLEKARWVDAVTAAYASTLTPGRYFSLVDAKIIEADPASAEARRQANALDRFVRTGQSTEHGHKTLVARATAGEIIYLVAVIDRIAQILALQGPGHPGHPRPRPPTAGLGRGRHHRDSAEPRDRRGAGHHQAPQAPAQRDPLPPPLPERLHHRLRGRSPGGCRTHHHRAGPRLPAAQQRDHQARR